VRLVRVRLERPTKRASDAMRSERIGIRLYAMADDPSARLERLVDLAERLQHADVAG
jgi:hypothetical protein